MQVDFTTSAEMHRTVVNHGVDEELDIMKRTYDGIEDLLNRTSQTIAATVPPQYSLDLNVIFFPQIGFLISMPVDPETMSGSYEGGDTDEQRWDRIFSTGSRVYYKEFRMRELDQTLGDMYAVICGTMVRLCLIAYSSVLVCRQRDRDHTRPRSESITLREHAEQHFGYLRRAG